VFINKQFKITVPLELQEKQERRWNTQRSIYNVDTFEWVFAYCSVVAECSALLLELACSHNGPETGSLG
jgi:hypothetical protein